MSTRFEFNSARREFVRMNADISVRYKFLSKEIDLGTADKIYEGTTNCLSGGGCLLNGKIPSLNWIPALLMGKINLGINILLPAYDHAIKALCSTAWVEEIPEGTDRCVMGLKYVNIEKEMQDQILKYLIKAQMTK